MIRIAMAFVLCCAASGALAAPDACSVTGTAFDSSGRPLHTAVVRLVDVQGQQSAFSATDARATFAFDSVMPTGRYRLDVLSAPTAVTGSHIRTRSVLGMSPTFACGAGELTHQDVRALID